MAIMLPYFAKLSEKIIETMYSLVAGPRDSPTKRKRTNDIDAFNNKMMRGPMAKKMRINNSEEERDGPARKRSCVNNNNKKDNSEEEERGGEVGNPSGKQEGVIIGNESPLKALLSIKKEHGSSRIRPRARNPYSTHKFGATRVVHWTEDQLEVLRSALASYRYSPKTTRDRVFVELRVSHRGFSSFTKEDVGNWLSKRCDYDCSQRIQLRKRKIAEMGEFEVCEHKKTRTIRFSEETQQKYFSSTEMTSALGEKDDGVVYVPLKE